MELLMVNKTMNEIKKVDHSFTSKEREFIVQFAFRTLDVELTSMLIDELVESVDDKDTVRIMSKYSVMYDSIPDWVRVIEELLVSIEIYVAEEEKALGRLTEILAAYGIDVSEEEIEQTGAKKEIETEMVAESKYTLREKTL